MTDYADEHVYLADVLASDEKSNKTYTLQVGALPNEVIAQEVEIMSPSGLVSRPSKADSSTASQALCSDMGNKSFCLGVRETRNLPSVSEGEVMLYAGGSDTNAQARVYLKADGSVNLSTKQGNTSSGATVSLVLASDPSFTLTIGNVSSISVDQAGMISLGSNATNFVADSTKVAAELTKIAAALQSLTSPAGAVTGSTYAPGSVAATKVKAE